MNNKYAEDLGYSGFFNGKYADRRTEYALNKDDSRHEERVNIVNDVPIADTAADKRPKPMMIAEEGKKKLLQNVNLYGDRMEACKKINLFESAFRYQERLQGYIEALQDLGFYLEPKADPVIGVTKYVDVLPLKERNN